MSKGRGRIARLAVAAVIVVPALVGSLAATSGATTTKQDVDAARARLAQLNEQLAAAGEVAELGEGVTGFAVGDCVAVEPARRCTRCEYCTTGRYHLCRKRALTAENGALAGIISTRGGVVIWFMVMLPLRQACAALHRRDVAQS